MLQTLYVRTWLLLTPPSSTPLKKMHQLLSKVIGSNLFSLCFQFFFLPLLGLRLVGGSGSWEGRVEVYYNNIWGTICDDSWDIYDARVVCRQLGFFGAVSAPGSARFGAGSGQIWLDDVACLGSESSILYCGHNGWGSHNCGHSEDASVICLGMWQ